MGTVPAGQLLRVWGLRLRIHQDGRLKWPKQTRTSVEGLVARLQSLDPHEEIGIDGDEDRDPIARCIRVSTGEVLGELYQVPRDCSIGDD